GIQGGDEARSRKGGAEGRLSRGSLLPAERGDDGLTAAPGACAGHPSARATLLRQVRASHGQAAEGHGSRGHGRAVRIPLAGERSRARKRHRAGGGALLVRVDPAGGSPCADARGARCPARRARPADDARGGQALVREQGARRGGRQQAEGRRDPRHRPRHAPPHAQAPRRGLPGRMTRPALCGVLGLFLSACSALGGTSDRSDVLRRILPSAVQLRAEREGGGRRAASGVVLASDATSKRCWILTTRHLLDPSVRQDVFVASPTRKGRVKAVVKATSPDIDLAVIEVEGMSLPAVTLKQVVRLGDEVWVAAFPWGKPMTVVGGVVSQLSSEEGELSLEGTIRMVDASVSYGASGGGVFDAETGALVGIVEGYRTAQVSMPDKPDRPLQLPVAGETTVIPARS